MKIIWLSSKVVTFLIHFLLIQQCNILVSSVKSVITKHPVPLETRSNIVICFGGFLSGSVIKNPATNTGDTGLFSESGRSPGEENDNHSSILD